MSVQVTQPDKKESGGLGKVTQIFQMGMQAKNMMGKGSQPQPTQRSNAMQRRMDTMYGQQKSGDQGPF